MSCGIGRGEKRRREQVLVVVPFCIKPANDDNDDDGGGDNDPPSSKLVLSPFLPCRCPESASFIRSFIAGISTLLGGQLNGRWPS